MSVWRTSPYAASHLIHARDPLLRDDNVRQSLQIAYAVRDANWQFRPHIVCALLHVSSCMPYSIWHTHRQQTFCIHGPPEEDLTSSGTKQVQRRRDPPAGAASAAWSPSRRTPPAAYSGRSAALCTLNSRVGRGWRALARWVLLVALLLRSSRRMCMQHAVVALEGVRRGDKGGKSPMRCCSDDLGRGVLEGGLAGANHMRR